MTTTEQTTVSAPAPKGGVAVPVLYDDRRTDENGRLVVKEWNQAYVGAVLATYSKPSGFDSYDTASYAVVFDTETNEFRHMNYADTRGGWGYNGVATVDATDEVKAAARAALGITNLERLASEAAANAKAPEKGKTVRVTKGRKVPHGTTGTVVWKGVDNYANNSYRTHYRLGVKTDDGTVFLSAENVEVVDPQDYMPAWSTLEAQARREAERDNWVR